MIPAKQAKTRPTPTWQILVITLGKLAWRNLWRNRKRTVITLSSIAVGFALAVLFIGIGDGSHNSMIRNAIQLGEGHLTIQPKNYQAAPSNHLFLHNGKQLQAAIKALDIPGKVMPRISIQTLASTASNSVGAGLLGIETESSLQHPLDPMAEKVSQLNSVAAQPWYRYGLLPQLSRQVAGVSIQKDVTPLWNVQYLLLSSWLKNAQHDTEASWLNQLNATYSLSNESSLLISALFTNGKGLTSNQQLQSEFGAVPLSVTAKFVMYF